MNTATALLAPTAADAVVIGAGPVGLFQVFQLGLHGLRAHVIDALPHPGGQCAELYGDKPIYDIPAIGVCSGHELVQRLCARITPFAPAWHLGERVDCVEPLSQGGFLVATLAAFGAAEWLAGASVPLEYTTSSKRLQGFLGVQASAD